MSRPSGEHGALGGAEMEESISEGGSCWLSLGDGSAEAAVGEAARAARDKCFKAGRASLTLST